MRPSKITTLITAAAVALAPTAAAAASAGAPQDPAVRAAAQTSDANHQVGEGTTVFLGLLLLILFAMAVLSDDDEPNNVPASP